MHWNFLSAMCLRTWTFKPRAVRKLFPQNLQILFSSPTFNENEKNVLCYNENNGPNNVILPCTCATISLNICAHISHWKAGSVGFGKHGRFLCFHSEVLWRYTLEQISQLYSFGRSINETIKVSVTHQVIIVEMKHWPMWIAICTRSVDFLAKDLEQIGHWTSLSPVWIAMCCLK